MSHDVIVVLLVSGAALELSGLALVAWDVVDARRQRAELSRQNQLVQVGSASASAGGFPPRGVVTGGEPRREPTIDERVAQLESDTAAIKRRLDAIDEREKQDHRSMLERVSGWVAEARRETFELREELDYAELLDVDRDRDRVFA